MKIKSTLSDPARYGTGRWFAERIPGHEVYVQAHSAPEAARKLGAQIGRDIALVWPEIDTEGTFAPDDLIAHYDLTPLSVEMLRACAVGREMADGNAINALMNRGLVVLPHFLSGCGITLAGRRYLTALDSPTAPTRHQPDQRFAKIATRYSTGRWWSLDRFGRPVYVRAMHQDQAIRLLSKELHRTVQLVWPEMDTQGDHAPADLITYYRLTDGAQAALEACAEEPIQLAGPSAWALVNRGLIEDIDDMIFAPTPAGQAYLKQLRASRA